MNTHRIVAVVSLVLAALAEGFAVGAPFGRQAVATSLSLVCLGVAGIALVRGYRK